MTPQLLLHAARQFQRDPPYVLLISHATESARPSAARDATRSLPPLRAKLRVDVAPRYGLAAEPIDHDPIADRTREHLGSSDRAVVAMRRKLLDAARAHAQTGALPQAVVEPTLYAVRSVQVVLDLHETPADSLPLLQGMKVPAAT